MSAAKSAPVSDRMGLARMLKSRLTTLDGQLVHLSDSSSLLSTGHDLVEALEHHSAKDGVQSLGQLNAATRDIIARLNRHLADLENFKDVNEVAARYRLTKTIIATQNTAPTFWRLESPELPTAITSKYSTELAQRLQDHLQAQRQSHDEALEKFERLVSTLEYAVDTFSVQHRQAWDPTMSKISNSLIKAQIAPELHANWIEQNVKECQYLLGELKKANPARTDLANRMWRLSSYGEEILVDSTHKENWCDQVTRLEDDLRESNDPDQRALQVLNERAKKLIDVYEQFFSTTPSPVPATKKIETAGARPSSLGDGFEIYQDDNPFGALPTAKSKSAVGFSSAVRSAGQHEDSAYLVRVDLDSRLRGVSTDAAETKRRLAVAAKGKTSLVRRVALYAGSGLAYVGGLGTLWMASPTVGTAAGMALVSGTVGALAWSRRRTVQGEVISSGTPVPVESAQVPVLPAAQDPVASYPEQDAILSDEQVIKVNGIREHIEDLIENTSPGALLSEQLRLSNQRLSETVTAFSSLRLSTDSRRDQAATEFSTQLDLIAGEVRRLAEAIDDEALRTQSAHGSYLRDAFGVSELNLEKTDE